ncbi:hypothetical protein Q8W71_10410 [Methylobacterium sp. NEAU 140]|uniref:hypothetical protein n=1 Tax=Methylobacterium sp. NEAU 140 TaxID=3064945 RepID=UPI0027328504|nr:hypothetical protein [Methylobacterium sp. NEAU 140]MDP4023037.1 hypothetical protein [Methylobacterium sp. NEAU 140]
MEGTPDVGIAGFERTGTFAQARTALSTAESEQAFDAWDRHAEPEDVLANSLRGGGYFRH